MSAKNFTYQNREFSLSLMTEGNKLQRAVINDGGLEFPFVNYEKAAEFLVSEYGGSKEAALAVLNETISLEGFEVSGVAAPIAPQTENKSKAKKEKKEKAPKAPKAPKEKKEKPQKPEAVEMTFELPGGTHTKKVQFKTILPDQKPIETEDVALDDTYALHIDIYSAKNRTSKLTNVKTGEVLIENVSLMDVIYKYAEAVGMTFPQADKYIKIKRGLIEESKPREKKEKVTAEDLKGGATTQEKAE